MQGRKKLILLIIELMEVVQSVPFRFWTLFRHASFLCARQTKTFSHAPFTFFLSISLTQSFWS